MEILDFFEPLETDKLQTENGYEEASWYYALESYNGDKSVLDGKRLALIGIEEPGDKISASYEIRKYLYSLKRAEYAEEVIDLGNFRFNYKQKAFESLGFVISELISNNIVPIILNGKQHIAHAQYLAFTYLKQYVNFVTFDPQLDFDLRENKEIDETNYLQNILTVEPSYLFGYTNIGYQSHFTDSNILDFLERLHFDLYRLGDVRANMTDLEPVLRSAHFAAWDLSAIKQSDAPGTLTASPNGFYGEEACLLSRYAGIGSNLRSIGFYNFAPQKDKDGQTAHLCAQMIWYFVDGFLNRYPESPLENKEDFQKYITSLKNNGYQIVFYKSTRTDRWWMEVPLNDKDFAGGTHIMPCSYNDYLAAMREELPERWLAAMKKLS